MMINCLPELMTQRDLEVELNLCGFQQLYDFCHLPWNFQRSRNEGFAFVNFVNTSIAQAFERGWQNRILTASAGGSQQVVIVRSQVQGLQENVTKWCAPCLRCIEPKA